MVRLAEKCSERRLESALSVPTMIKRGGSPTCPAQLSWVLLSSNGAVGVAIGDASLHSVEKSAASLHHTTRCLAIDESRSSSTTWSKWLLSWGYFRMKSLMFFTAFREKRFLWVTDWNHWSFPHLDFPPFNTRDMISYKVLWLINWLIDKTDEVSFEEI